MATCENCGKDHELDAAKIRETFPEQIMLERALSYVSEEVAPDDLPKVIVDFCEFTSETNLPPFLDWARGEGLMPRKAMEVFGTTMIRVGLCVGAKVGHGFPLRVFEDTPLPTSEEASAIFDERMESRSEHSEEDDEVIAALNADLVKVLRQHGVITDDFDGDLKVIHGTDLETFLKAKILQEKGDEETGESKPPGLYL